MSLLTLFRHPLQNDSEQNARRFARVAISKSRSSERSPMAPRLLVIEDDAIYAHRLQANLSASGYFVDVTETGEKALAKLRNEFFDLVVTDIRLPDISGLEILGRIKRGEEAIGADLPVVVLTSVRDVDTAVGAMRDGAADFLTKESEKQEIVMRIKRVLDQSAILNENRYLRDQPDRQNEFREIIGESTQIRAIKDEISGLSGENVSVLITGETGVGKELIARALHRTGPNPRGPFIDINCGALPDENLLLSELFGHEKGAFTGAISTKRGKFEAAQNGTLFLDEIGDMPLNAQVKVLKAVETLEFSRLGGNVPVCVGCRLIFATNKNLEEEVKAGKFRQDLLYRVNLFPIQVPPLRNRTEDIVLLARFFLSQFAALHRKPPLRFSNEALAALQAFNWPGNVRELRNVVERLVIRSKSHEVTAADLQRCGVGHSEPAVVSVESLLQAGTSLEEIERKLVVEALEKSDWNQKEAAKLLGISVDRMNARVKKFNLTHSSWRVNR
jgi:DNA-binding NtrC family response regulator